MIGKVTTLMVVLSMAHVAAAGNVIKEWGGHTPADYRVVIDPETGDHVGVWILGNTQPALPWKFEAYDSDTQDPGHIDYIRIDPSVTVGSIKLNVIGKPPLHDYGAQDLDLLNLVDHGTSTNVLEIIDIAGDCGADGQVQAYGADSITIGGNLGPYGIHVLGGVTGDVRVEGTGPHSGSLAIAASAGP